MLDHMKGFLTTTCLMLTVLHAFSAEPVREGDAAVIRKKLVEVAREIEEQHQEWERLDREARAHRDDPKVAGSYRAAITKLKIWHDRTHAREEKLKADLAKVEEEQGRRVEIEDMEKEADALLKKVEALRKKAEALQRKQP